MNVLARKKKESSLWREKDGRRYVAREGQVM